MKFFLCEVKFLSENIFKNHATARLVFKFYTMLATVGISQQVSLVLNERLSHSEK